MLTMTRLSREFVALTCMMSILIYACGAETLAAYSGQYTADLEQKQALLESIKEDAYKTENAMKEKIENANTCEDKKISRLEVGCVGLAKFIPATQKINLALVSMSSTLSPKDASERFPQDK